VNPNEPNVNPEGLGMNPGAREMIPQGGTRELEQPFWTYEDLAVFVGAALPAFLISALLIRVAQAWVPVLFASEAVKTLLFQSLVYLLLLGALYLLVSVRYGQPFWLSLGWTLVYRGALLCLVAGPPLSIALAALGVVLRAPVVVSKIEEMITGRGSLVMVVVFGSVLGPIFEELVFRGFLFPLLARSLGAWPGIVLTAIPFALLHGPQDQWAWQQVVLVGLAGVAFGYTRYKTGSTAASAMVHAGYNATLFLVFIVQRWVLTN